MEGIAARLGDHVDDIAGGTAVLAPSSPDMTLNSSMLSTLARLMRDS